MAERDLGELLNQPSSAFNLSPTAQSALLSFGLQAMQPVGIGQTPLGALAQAIGAAGETVTRQEVLDQKADESASGIDQADEKLNIARESEGRRANTDDRRLGLQKRGLDIQDRRADIAEKAVNKRGMGLSEAFRTRLDYTARQAYERDIAQQAGRASKAANDSLLPPDKASPFAKYKGMNEAQIREKLKEEQPYRGQQYTTGNPIMEDPEGEEDEDPLVAAPSTPRAVQAPMKSVDFLRKNPHTREEFDARYGKGAAAQILGR